MTIKGLNYEKVTYYKVRSRTPKKPLSNIVSSLQMKKLVYVQHLDLEEPKPQDVRVVTEYTNMFTEEIP